MKTDLNDFIESVVTKQMILSYLIVVVGGYFTNIETIIVTAFCWLILQVLFFVFLQYTEN